MLSAVLSSVQEINEVEALLQLQVLRIKWSGISLNNLYFLWSFKLNCLGKTPGWSSTTWTRTATGTPWRSRRKGRSGCRRWSFQTRSPNITPDSTRTAQWPLCQCKMVKCYFTSIDSSSTSCCSREWQLNLGQEESLWHSFKYQDLQWGGLVTIF